METNKIYQEPCLETLRKMPNDFLDCVITSPPYWQLRDYGYDGQWGLEPTFEMYLDNLWSMMDEIKRCLKPTGTVWINLGDTYSTQSGGMRAAQDNFESKESKYGAFEKPIIQPKTFHKSLLLLPHRFAIGCMERGWIVRNDIVWAKRNGMPESVTDRFSKKHEYFFFMTKSEKYFFDLDAIRDKHKWAHDKRNDGNRHTYTEGSKSNENEMLSANAVSFNINGKNPGGVSDFWDVPTKPSTSEHYASYNDNLLKKPVLAGCPEYVCIDCGKPKEKITETKAVKAKREHFAEQSNGQGQQSSTGWKPATSQDTGFTDCGCEALFDTGIIYDPFMGTGSTAEVALRANRRFIGSEMSEDYVKIANKRLAPFLVDKLPF